MERSWDIPLKSWNIALVQNLIRLHGCLIFIMAGIYITKVHYLRR